MKKNFVVPDDGKKVVLPSDAAVSPSQMSPTFVRLPRPGQRELFSGLTRSTLFNLIKTGRVKSHSLKMPGCSRGIRLIDFKSLCEAISGTGQQEAAKGMEW
jgi:hypothetical protein